MSLGFGNSLNNSLPGMQAAIEGFESEIAWGRFEQLRFTSAVISGAARDAGASPTTQLRPGLLLGRIAASGLLSNYDPDATDGTDVAVAILGQPISVVNLEATNVDKWVQVLVGGPVKAAKIVNLDPQARGQLGSVFYFDDDPIGGRVSEIQTVRVKATDYTVVPATDSHIRFSTRGAAGAVIFTVPTPTAAMKGCVLEFFNEANQNMTVTCATAKLVTFNNLAATSVAFSTTNEKIGSGFRLTANDAGDKWHVDRIGAGAATVTVA